MFLFIGLIATISIRAVAVLVHIRPLYGQIAWYVGVCGFLVFFLRKFRVDRARSQLIARQRLMEKITRDNTIGPKDRELIAAILCTIRASKDRINYFVIFSSSVLALAGAIYIDFFK